MMTTNVELYEALKPTVGADAARMIAEIIPPGRDVALKSDIDSLRSEMREGFAKVRGEMHAESTRTIKWFLGVFVPILAGTWGTMVAVLLKY
jgi:hypothetical protein